MIAATHDVNSEIKRALRYIDPGTALKLKSYDEFAGTPSGTSNSPYQ